MKMMKPIIVLTVICLIASGALALTNSKTAGPIKKVNEKILKEAEKEVLPDGKGKAVQGTAKSFGGDLTVMVGIGEDGKIIGVKVPEHADTPGLGTKAHDAEYLKQYAGISELKAAKIKEDKQVKAVTGATISSNGVYNAVKDALKKGGK